MGIDLSRFKVIYDNKVLRAVALMRMEIGDECDITTVNKPKMMDIMVINEDGNIVLIRDEAWRFQFLPITTNEGA